MAHFPHSLFYSCVTEAIAKLAFCITVAHKAHIAFLGPFLVQTNEEKEAYGKKKKRHFPAVAKHRFVSTLFLPGVCDWAWKSMLTTMGAFSCPQCLLSLGALQICSDICIIQKLHLGLATICPVDFTPCAICIDKKGPCFSPCPCTANWNILDLTAIWVWQSDLITGDCCSVIQEPR